ncbi:hypothetical protein AGABI1DRAFT_118743 [Agaricus bisporus var. burnettii JB137-S8]|uniref:Uncharacterized protein n=1 Tax=Agaricus bisporus var. burnettii (strain JB137-S8 / ATCC MYA-4627 / FGSC 10392) TaxID=597362 RepID=K5W4D1_AGABU|nr:uncharacterized protein AGABI1DRAFT_118743 [Agaricus bisporus var. burnettii JB137-S8]EKM81639.1 hypothetical protein AGABI1DRAFT_118743 [Agaricus bisporus var. burnettii JB137-S8]
MRVKIETFPDLEQVFKELDHPWAICRTESCVGPGNVRLESIFVRLVDHSDR